MVDRPELSRASAPAPARWPSSCCRRPRRSPRAGRIDSLPTLSNGDLGIVFSAVGLATGDTIDLSTVKVSINGQPVPATAKLVADTQPQPLRQTMLTIDLSGSMGRPIGTTATTRIAAAEAGCGRVSRGRPQGRRTSASSPSPSAATVALAPTQDHAKVKRMVDGLAATNGSTALFDAVVAANGALDPKGIDNQLSCSPTVPTTPAPTPWPPPWRT